MKHRPSTRIVLVVALTCAASALAPAQTVHAQITHQDHTLTLVQSRGLRPRLGVAATGAVFFEGPGAAGGISAHIGIQFSDIFAIYYLATGLVGSAGSGGGRLVGTVWNTAMAELTLGHVLQIGVGPSLDALFGCESIQVGGGTSTWCSNNAPHVGSDGRLAMAFGSKGASSRGGIFIALDAHPTFLPNLVLMTVTASVGIQLY